MLDKTQYSSNIQPIDEWGGRYLQNGRVYGRFGEFIEGHPLNAGKRAPKPAKAKVEGKVSTKLTAAELLMLQEELKFFEFRKKAKEIFGDDCPKDKKGIIDKLEKRAAEPKQAKSPQALTWQQLSGNEINLTAWVQGDVDYIFPDVMSAIRSRYHKNVTNIAQAIEFLVDEGVVDAKNARDSK